MYNRGLFWIVPIHNIFITGFVCIPIISTFKRIFFLLKYIKHFLYFFFLLICIILCMHMWPWHTNIFANVIFITKAVHRHTSIMLYTPVKYHNTHFVQSSVHIKFLFFSLLAFPLNAIYSRFFDCLYKIICVYDFVWFIVTTATCIYIFDNCHFVIKPAKLILLCNIL